MSMSCLRIRSSRRSSGPSYTWPTVTAKGNSLGSRLIGCVCVISLRRGLTRRRFVLLRHLHRPAHLLHRSFSGAASATCTIFEQVPCFSRILLIMPPALLHRVQHRNQSVCCPTLALDAADSGTAATRVHLLQCIARTENLMHISDGAYIGISRIRAPHPSWIGHHRLQFLPNDRFRIAH